MAGWADGLLEEVLREAARRLPRKKREEGIKTQTNAQAREGIGTVRRLPRRADTEWARDTETDALQTRRD